MVTEEKDQKRNKKSFKNNKKDSFARAGMTMRG
jgi:hypothetical protein